MVLACILLAGRPCAFALNPTLDVSQYAHTAWKVREGFTKGTIHSIAQTPDGYLWLATDFGLLRFDGVRNVPWQPPAGQHLPSTEVRRLLAARDGTIWIGTSNGLASWKEGKLTQYPELGGQRVFTLLEDREGTVWAGEFGIPTGRLCAIQNGTVRCYGQDGSLGRAVFSLYEDSKGSLWMGVDGGLWRWKPGPPKFYALLGDREYVQTLGEDSDGALLIVMRGGIRRFTDGKTEKYPLSDPGQHFSTYKLLRDRDGSLWIATLDRGLLHVHQGRADGFAQSDGLTADSVENLFEDREGTIWVATSKGLDRFRDFAVATFSVKQGLSSDSALSVLAAKDGSVWLGTSDGLDRWNNRQMSTYDKRDGKLNGLYPHSLFQDDRGRIGVSTFRGLGYLENGAFVPVRGVPGGIVRSFAEDKAGNLWIANQDLGLFRLPVEGAASNEVQQIPWARLGHKDFATALAADPSRGSLWLGFFNGGVAYFRDGQVRGSYTSAEGLGEGWLTVFDSIKTARFGQPPRAG